jgi:carboxypeptidase family protein
MMGVASASASNDDFASAQQIEQLEFTTTSVWSGDATTEPSEPSSCGPVSRTVWFQLMPDYDTHLLASMTRSDAHVVVGVYTGSSIDALTNVACQSPEVTGEQRKFSFSVSGSIRYYIQLGTPPEEADGMLRLTLEYPSYIFGRVSRSDGSALVGACITAYDPEHRLGGTTTAGENGYYGIYDLPSDQYRIFFEDCASHASPAEWFHNKPDFESATPIETTSGWDRWAAAILGPAASISGVVTNATSGLPASDACVYAYTAEHEIPGNAKVRPDGTYTIAELLPAIYKIRFTGCPEGDYFSRWYDDRPTFSEADPVPVLEGQDVLGVDGTLVSSTGTGVITGHITDENTGEPLSPICVYVYLETGEYKTSAATSPDGNYRIENLATGSYRLSIGCTPGTHYPEWYNNKTTFETADPVQVTNGTETVADFALKPIGNGRISGRITDASTGTPLADMCVWVYERNQQLRTTAQSAADGTYTTGEVLAGHHFYRVGFSDCGRDAYANEYYNDVREFDQASSLTVPDGGITSNIDAALDPIPPPPPPTATDLTVAHVAVTNEAFPFSPVDVGWQRTISVTVTNLGDDYPVDARLVVTACPRTVGACKQIGDEPVSDALAGEQTLFVRWNGLGMVGDVRLTAHIEYPTDTDPSNNDKMVDYYVHARDTGVGVGPPA